MSIPLLPTQVWKKIMDRRKPNYHVAPDRQCYAKNCTNRYLRDSCCLRCKMKACWDHWHTPSQMCYKCLQEL